LGCSRCWGCRLRCIGPAAYRIRRGHWFIRCFSLVGFWSVHNDIQNGGRHLSRLCGNNGFQRRGLSRRPLATTWAAVHSHEVYFRDTAHGFLAWAFATLLSASLLGAAATHLVGGASQVLGQNTAQTRSGPAELFVDKVLRPAPGLTPAAVLAVANIDQAARGELSRLFIASVRDGHDVSATDRIYVVKV